MNIKQDKSGEGLPITRIETIADANINGFRVGYAGLEENDCRDWLMESGDILFSHINSVEHIGKCAVYRGAPEKLVHGMNLLCLRCNRTKLFPEFAKYLIRSPAFRSRLSTFINKAVNQASVSIGNLKTIPVVVPALEEQRRIADVLDRAEELRSKRREAIAQLDTLTQAIFLEMFGDPVTNPKGIKVVRLSEITTRITDGVHQKPNYTENGVPFISVKNITTGSLKFEDCKFISLDDHLKFTKRCKAERLDILYTKVGATYGRPALVDTDCEFSIYVSVCLIKPDKKLIDPFFLNAALGTTAVKSQADRKIKGIGVPDLHLDQIQNFLIPLPSMKEQQEFAHRVEAVEKLKAAHRASLSELDALFASLQHRAFRGEL
jgi:type I restriction enzyme S subunit